MALLINRKEIEQLLTLREAIEAVEIAFEAMGNDPLLNHPRRRLHWRPGDARKLNIFAGSLPDMGYIGAMVRFDYPNQPDSRKGKAIEHPPAAYEEPLPQPPHGQRVVYVLFDAEGLVSVQYGGSIGRGTPVKGRTWSGDPIILRTAATSALGTKYLARQNSEILGFFGTGYYAPSHLAAMTLVCQKLKEARVYSPNEKHKLAFCREISQVVDLPVVAVSQPKEAVEGADVILCCTNAVNPVFDSDWVKEGVHVTGIVGQNNYLNKGEWWGATEVDDRFLSRCATIVVNSIEQAKQDQQATTWDAERRGVIRWEKVHELGDIITGKVPGRTSETEITFYQNNAGQGIADLALAIKYYKLAKKHGLGTEIGS
jgi:ornithine cyclodeaminase/alanine dehydrogenase-like protein (mu-crystallin family)